MKASSLALPPLQLLLGRTGAEGRETGGAGTHGMTLGQPYLPHGPRPNVSGSPAATWDTEAGFENYGPGSAYLLSKQTPR